MSYRRFVLRTLAAAASVFALALPLQGAAQAAGDKKVQFMDLQWLKPGVTAQQAGAYFSDKLDPIVRKHGGKILFTYQVAAVMRGDVKPALIASMEFPSMDAMQGLFKDPDYQRIVPQRDATFDLSKQVLYQVAPAGGK